MMATKKNGGFPMVALICAICLSGISKTTGELSCVDENGDQVDWYMGYKFPALNEEPFKTGHAYAYISSESVKKFDSVNDDLQFDRNVEDLDSLSFLQRFKGLLVRFGGHFKLTSKKAPPKMTRNMSNREKNLKEARWVLSQKLITDPKSAVMRTLEPAYASTNLKTISSIYYNDNPRETGAFGSYGKSGDESDGESENGDGKKEKSFASSFAHAKGVLLMEEKTNTGVWFTHSVPKFPTIRTSDLEYPDSGKPNGQTFMCITFNLDESGGKLIRHLGNMKPIVYDRHLTDSIIAKFPDLDKLKLYDDMLGRKSTELPNLAQTIQTKGGQLMRLYSKPQTFKKDIYVDWIDQDIGNDLFVETWRNGKGGKLDSTCPKNKFHVNNVKNLKYLVKEEEEARPLNWAYTIDHSKWAITDKPEFATACICDANRVASQFVRGSGCVCINCPTCWNVFNNMIAEVEPCPVQDKGNKSSRKLETFSEPTVKKIEEYLDAIDFVE